jgi:hypothetical protein
MKLTPGRCGSASLADCSLQFLVERRMVPSVPGAAYP